jgi:hypothetical protein
MKSFKVFVEEHNILDKKTYTVNEIALKHNTTPENIEEQLTLGIKVETEHTTNTEVAREIALDHLNEDPEYYTKLKKANL